MNIRRLTIEDAPDLEELIALIEAHLPRAEWWLPIHEDTKANFFNDSLVFFLGAFDGKRLTGATALFFEKKEYEETLARAGVDLPDAEIAEIGRCMVAPAYRGQNLLLTLNTALVQTARERGLSHLMATVHPDNVSSNRSMQKLGMQRICEVTVHGGYRRNVYLMSL